MNDSIFFNPPTLWSDFFKRYPKFYEDKTGFVGVEDHYELKINLPKEITKDDDIRVTLEDENLLEVSYNHSKNGCKISGKLTTNLPEDANTSTLTAKLSDNVLNVVVKKQNKTAKKREITIV